MTVPPVLPLVLSELERLGVQVESAAFDRDAVTVETGTAGYRCLLEEMRDSGDPAEWAQVVASRERGAQA